MTTNQINNQINSVIAVNNQSGEQTMTTITKQETKVEYKETTVQVGGADITYTHKYINGKRVSRSAVYVVGDNSYTGRQYKAAVRAGEMWAVAISDGFKAEQASKEQAAAEKIAAGKKSTAAPTKESKKSKKTSSEPSTSRGGEGGEKAPTARTKTNSSKGYKLPMPKSTKNAVTPTYFSAEPNVLNPIAGSFRLTALAMPSMLPAVFEALAYRTMTTPDNEVAPRWTGRVRYATCRLSKGVKPQLVAAAKAAFAAKTARAAELFSLSNIERTFGYPVVPGRESEPMGVSNGSSVVRPMMSVGAASNASDAGLTADAVATSARVTPKGETMKQTIKVIETTPVVANEAALTVSGYTKPNKFKLHNLAAVTELYADVLHRAYHSEAVVQAFLNGLVEVKSAASKIAARLTLVGNMATIAKAMVLAEAGGLEFPFAEGTEFTVPRAIKKEIPGYNLLQVHGKEITIRKGKDGLTGQVVAIATELKKTKSDVKILVPSTKVIEWQDKHLEAGLDEYVLTLDATWNYPRYNATAATVRKVLDFINAEFDRFGIHNDLRYVRSEETDRGLKVTILDEVFYVTDKEVLFESYAPMILGQVLLYPPVDRRVAVEETYVMNGHDLFLFALIEHALIHLNRLDGTISTKRNSIMGEIELKKGLNNIKTTISFAQQGFSLFVNNKLPMFDLEGSIDLDVLKKRHVQTNVSPCPRIFEGTEELLVGGAVLSSWKKKSGNASKNEAELSKQCDLSDSGFGTMQPIVEACNELGLAVIVTDNARSLSGMSILACSVKTLPTVELKKQMLVAMVTRFGNCKCEADAIRFYEDAIGVVEGLEVGSNEWWNRVAEDYVIPYSTKGAKIAKRLIAAHVAMPIEGASTAGMQWADFDEVITERTGETIIAPTFNLSAPGIGYANTDSRDRMAAKYRTATKPASIAGVVKNAEFLVEGDWTLCPATDGGWNVFTSEGVWVNKGQEVAKFVVDSGEAISFEADSEGYLYEFSWRQQPQPTFNVHYFEVASKLWNMANTVKLRDGIKLNAVWSNSDLFKMNGESRSWDLFVPADAFKEGDILWYFLPEAAASFRRLAADFTVEVNGVKVSPRELIREANAATLATFGGTELIKADTKGFDSDTELMYLPQADLLGIYKPIRNAFKAMFGQSMWVSYDNAPDLHEFIGEFYGNAVKSNAAWRELTATELSTLGVEGIEGEAFAICDTEVITAATNIIVTWTKSNGDKAVAWRGWTYASRNIDGQWVELHYPIRVEYTTISQSVSDSKVMFGTTADLGSADYETGKAVYDAGEKYHNRYMLVQSLLEKKSNTVQGVTVKKMGGADTIEAVFSKTQIESLKALVNVGSRVEFLKALAASTQNLILEVPTKDSPVWLYAPVLVSFGLENVKKSSAMTMAGRAYEYFARLIHTGCAFGDATLLNSARSISNLLTSMAKMKSITDEFGDTYTVNNTDVRCTHRESILFGQRTVSSKVAACADIAIDRMYILKGSKMYRNFCKVFGVEKVTAAAKQPLADQMSNPTLWVAPYRPPMTKAVPVGVVFISERQNERRAFPLSGERAYCSMFFMNYNMGDMDGDGISFSDVTESVKRGALTIPTMQDMMNFVHGTIGYSLTSVEYWNQAEPYMAEQYFADHFNVKPSAKKEQRGPVLKKSLLKWDEWTTNVRGAIDQQTIFVGCSYAAQAVHTLLVILLRDVLQKDWCDAGTRKFVANYFNYINDEFATYQVQAAYELALGGFDPNMATLAGMALQQAWSAKEGLAWYWNDTAFGNMFAVTSETKDLHGFGWSFNCVGRKQLVKAAHEVGYQEHHIDMLLNIFALAGMAKDANKGNNAAKDSFYVLVDTAPAFAYCLAMAQYVLDTSRNNPLNLFDMTANRLNETAKVKEEGEATDEAKDAAGVLEGMKGLAAENMTAYLVEQVRNIHNRVKNGAQMTAAEVETVVDLFESPIGVAKAEEVTETEEEVIEIKHTAPTSRGGESKEEVPSFTADLASVFNIEAPTTEEEVVVTTPTTEEVVITETTKEETIVESKRVMPKANTAPYEVVSLAEYAECNHKYPGAFMDEVESYIPEMDDASVEWILNYFEGKYTDRQDILAAMANKDDACYLSDYLCGEKGRLSDMVIAYEVLFMTRDCAQYIHNDLHAVLTTELDALYPLMAKGVRESGEGTAVGHKVDNYTESVQESNSWGLDLDKALAAAKLLGSNKVIKAIKAAMAPATEEEVVVISSTPKAEAPAPAPTPVVTVPTVKEKPVMKFNRQVIEVIEEVKAEVKELKAVGAQLDAEEASLLAQIAEAAELKKLREEAEALKAANAKKAERVNALRAQLAAALGVAVEEVATEVKTDVAPAAVDVVPFEVDEDKNDDGGTQVTPPPAPSTPKDGGGAAAAAAAAATTESYDEGKGGFNAAWSTKNNRISLRNSAPKAEAKVEAKVEVAAPTATEAEGQTSGAINMAHKDAALAKARARQAQKAVTKPAAPKPVVKAAAKKEEKAAGNGINFANRDAALARRRAAQAKVAEAGTFTLSVGTSVFSKPVMSNADLNQVEETDLNVQPVKYDGYPVAFVITFRSSNILVATRALSNAYDAELINKLNGKLITAVVTDYDFTADEFGVAELLQRLTK